MDKEDVRSASVIEANMRRHQARQLRTTTTGRIVLVVILLALYALVEVVRG